MIRYYDGTIFNAGTQGIVNTVNIVGVMGNGIALEYALRYPEMFEEYKQKCEDKELTIGKIHYYKAADGKIIINFPVKWFFQYPAKLPWVEEGLKYFVATYKEQGITSAAFPRLGCNLGHLSWSDVKPLMEKYLGDIDCDIVICEDKNKTAEGKEAEMVKAYNDFITGRRAIDIKLTPKQREALDREGEVNRFWKIKDFPGISAKVYKMLFNVFYKLDTAEELKEDKQLNMFEEFSVASAFAQDPAKFD